MSIKKRTEKQAPEVIADNFLAIAHQKAISNGLKYEDESAKEFRDAICKECGWSRATYYYKKKGRGMISPVEKEKIQELLFLITGIDLFILG